MQITGTITRLVPGSRRDKADERVFIRPDDPEVLRQVDGDLRTASGEIPSFEAIEGLELGAKHTIEIED